MKSEARKAAVTAYKEQTPQAGVYLVRCTASSELWVGHWLNVDTIQSRIWFTLRYSAHPNKKMLAAWRAYGEPAFSFEVLETIDEKTPVVLRESTLKERAAHWREQLGAAAT